MARGKTDREAGNQERGEAALDPRVEDIRKKILYLNPYSGWIPEGVHQHIVNIVDEDGEIIGELETGDDVFVQIATTVGRELVRISYYPKRDHASLRRTSL